MSNVSDLLNPAPSSAAGTPSHVQPPMPLHLESHNQSSQSFHPNSSQVRSPNHRAVISPGLDVLAAAASNTMPLFSPTHELSSTAQVMQQADSVQGNGSAEARASPKQSNGEQFLKFHQQHQGHDAPSRVEEIQTYTVNDTKPFLPPYNSLATTDGTSEIGHELGSTRSPLSADPVVDKSSTSHQAPLELSDAKQSSHPISSTSPTRSQNQVSTHADQIHIKAESGALLDLEMNDNSSPARHSFVSAHQDPTPGTPLKNVMSNNLPDSVAPNERLPAVLQKPKVGPPKKRAAPRKGTAVKPPSKKRKMETGSGKASPRTGTPATSRASGTPVPKKGKQDSATPTRSSSIVNQDEDDDDDDGELELFCICRKPDDHTVMIGCDGPCEDWFHTRCVNMTDEKVALISKWYCPNCAAEGHETEWKRMCRLDGCSNPARVEGPNRSKYCCNEHGQEFMISRLLPEKKLGTTSNFRKRRHDNYTDHFGNESFEELEEEDNRGGVLRAGELKILVDGVNDVTTFRKLGDGVLSPPDTAATSPQPEDKTRLVYSEEEVKVLNEIIQKRTQIEVRKQMLNDRATLIQMVDTRRKNVLAKLKEKEKSLKDICGYDSRLSWSEDELNDWRTSKEGAEQLHTNVLQADPSLVEKEKEEHGEDTEVGLGVCKKKRCERHRTWYKIQQADLAMEKDEVRQGLRKLDEEEKGVKERAMIRNLEDAQVRPNDI